MCKFFSFTTKGDGKPMYFDAKMRKEIADGKHTYEQDSHTSINDFFGLKGADEDKTNKYEFSFCGLVVDQLNTTDDKEQVDKWINRFVKTKKFADILAAYCISGSLYVRGCDLKGVKLPEKIGGWLDVSGCDLKGVKLPEEVGGKIYK